MNSYSIELIEIAENELFEAHEWYNKKQSGLGNRFFTEVSAYLKRIASNPYKFSIRYSNELRFAPLHVFPYLISYWIDEDRQIVFVLSIFHTSKNPGRFE